MPLLKGRFVTPIKPLGNLDPSETVYTIPHTKEQFRCKDEYEHRLALYKDRVWTCQCTGQIHLTHKEAWESEHKIHKILDENFPEIYQKPVLEVVHHSTDVLDMLTDQAWKKIHTELRVGEKVTLKVKNCQKSIEGIIVKVDKANEDSGANGSNCSSPSSNKENASDEDKTVKDDSPKKYSPHKLLPFKYSFKMANEEKVISGVPAEDLVRPHRPPSKDYVKMFIRASAVRGGYNFNSPWLVDEKLVEKYNLPSKFADFFVSPTKMAELGRKALEDASKKKRKHSSGSHKSTPPLKKARISNSHTKDKQAKVSPKRKDSSSKATPGKSGRPKKAGGSASKATVNGKSPFSKQPIQVVEVDSESDSDNEPLNSVMAKARSPTKSSSSSPQKELPMPIDSDSSSDDEPLINQASPRKSISFSSCKGTPAKADMNSIEISSSSDDEEPLKKPSSPKKKLGRPRKSDSTASPKKLGRPKKRDLLVKVENVKDSDEETLANLCRKEASGTPEVKKRGRPKKDSNMKQMTLFDMNKPKRGRPPGSPNKAKSPSKSESKNHKKSGDSPTKRYRLPPVAAKLRKAIEKQVGRQMRNKKLNECATLLRLEQIQQLPDDLREMVLKRYEQIQEKKKRAKMSPTELAEYLKKKNQEMKEERKKKAKNLNPNRRCEDTHLDLEPLPKPKLVSTPDGLPNELFGNIAMVTEFIHSYKGLLMPEGEKVINAEQLMNAIVSGAEGFTYLGRVISVLLQTLLQDEIAEEYRELGVPIRDIPVKSHTVSELVRLCLRQQDTKNDPDSDDEMAGDEMPEELVERLETVELFSLQPEDKLTLIRGLCHRLLNSYSVQDYMDEKQQQSSDLWRQRIACQRDANKKRKEEKDSSAHATAVVKEEESTAGKDNDKKGVTIVDFYGQKHEDKEAEEGLDLATVVKRRRVLAAKAVEEKQRKEALNKKKREKEYEDAKLAQHREQLETRFQEGIAVARMVLRQAPIGVDRNHNRYWVFCQTTDPRLYVEKGWAPAEINYTVRAIEDVTSSSSDDEENEAPTAGRPPRRVIEKTVPYVGQNLWFHYDNVADIDLLITRLHPNGIRERALKTELQKHYPALVETINASQKAEGGADLCNGEDELVDAFREELIDMEVRLRNGGLGGVPDFKPWEDRLKKATCVAHMGEGLIESQAYIHDKFLKGMMITKAKMPKVKVDEEEKGGDERQTDDGENAEEVKIGVERWAASVRSCSTYSRLHVLMGILDACVKWEKSAENVKCKICRKKSSDEHLLLCDECNQPFHLYCLRPALYTVPDGEWFCPACNPLKRRIRVKHNYAELADVAETISDLSSNEQEMSASEMEQEKQCARCGGDEGLVNCSTCPSAFHLECHDPPLRHEPRSSTWKCMQCKSGVRLRQTRGKASKARRCRYESDDYSDSPPPKKSYSRKNKSASAESDRTRSRRAAAPKYTLDDYVEEPTRSRRTRQSREATAELPIDLDTEEEEEEEEEASPVVRSGGHRKVSKKVSQADKDRKTMQDVLSRMRRNKHGWPFNEPVDPKMVPDYLDIVQSPMDLQTMEDKLVSDVYKTPQAFINDVARIFDNCELYNKGDSAVGRCLPPLEKMFKDVVHRQFPTCTYSRDPNLNVILLATSEEEEDGGQGESSEESETEDSSQSEDEYSSSGEVLDEHSYFNATPGR